MGTQLSNCWHFFVIKDGNYREDLSGTVPLTYQWTVRITNYRKPPRRAKITTKHRALREFCLFFCQQFFSKFSKNCCPKEIWTTTWKNFLCRGIWLPITIQNIWMRTKMLFLSVWIKILPFKETGSGIQIQPQENLVKSLFHRNIWSISDYPEKKKVPDTYLFIKLDQ